MRDSIINNTGDFGAFLSKVPVMMRTDCTTRMHKSGKPIVCISGAPDRMGSAYARVAADGSTFTVTHGARTLQAPRDKILMAVEAPTKLYTWFNKLARIVGSSPLFSEDVLVNKFLVSVSADQQVWVYIVRHPLDDSSADDFRMSISSSSGSSVSSRSDWSQDHSDLDELQQMSDENISAIRRKMTSL